MPFDAGQILATVQTAALVVTMIGQIYVLVLLRNQLRDTARHMQDVLDGLAETSGRLHAIEARLDR